MIHYKGLIEFKGEVLYFDEVLQKYKIKVTEWLGRGYPHLVYYLTKEEIGPCFNNNFDRNALEN